MLRNNLTRKKTINSYIMMFIVFMIIIIAVFLMIKYQVEGEKNLPFKVSNIKIVSTAAFNTEGNEENIWKLNLIQNNYIYFTIEKNSNYKKEDVIESIEINNFSITNKNEKGTTNIYVANPETSKFIYTEEYISNNIKFHGAEATNLGLLNINNQGGTIAFSPTTTELGIFSVNQNEKVQMDGTILKKVGITEEDVNFTINFDIIIETGSNHKFKANITLDLPEGDILETGVSKSENIISDKIVFKRI